MKKIFLLASLFALFMGFTACGDDDSEDKNPPASVSGDSSNDPTYTGKMTVTYEGEDFVTENMKCTCKINDGNTLTIGLIDVKFVPKMPVTLTLMEIPNVPYEEKDDVITFEAEKIIPLWNGNPFEMYMAKNLKGEITQEGVISYSLSFGSYPTSYTGKLMSK